MFERLRALIRRRVRYRVASGGAVFLFTLALTGSGAFLTGNNLLFLIFAAMMALLLVSGFLSRLVLAGLELELLIPQHVYALTPSPARIRVRNLKRFTPSLSIELSGEISDGRSFLSRAVYLPYIPGHATIEMPVEIVFPRRGRHGGNLFHLSTGFPFGFIRRTSPVELLKETIAFPVPATDDATLSLADSVAGGIARRGGPGKEFHRIRGYEPSDDARHVDWKGSARTGVLQVREFSPDREQTVEIWFDNRVAARDEARFEAAVSQCAAVCQRLARADHPVVFRCGPDAIAGRAGERIYDILLLLALVQPVILPVRASAPAAGEWPSGTETAGGGSALRIVFRAQSEEADPAEMHP